MLRPVNVDATNTAEQSAAKLAEQILEVHMADINDLKLVVEQQLARGDLPGALANIQKMQELARTITDFADLANPAMVQTGYFANSIATLEHAITHYNMRAKNNAPSFAKAIIDSALCNNRYECNPTIAPGGLKKLTTALTNSMIAHWHKFDRRGSSVHEDFFATLEWIIIADLGRHSLYARFISGVDLYLKDADQLCAKLDAAIKDYIPMLNAQPLALDILAPAPEPASEPARALRMAP
jgi:hypothetical protein